MTAMNARTPTLETTAPPVIDLDFKVMDDAELEHPYRVIIHNDDVTPMDFVVAVLAHYFEVTARRAVDIMFTAHHHGQALVTVLPYEEAHRRVYAAQSAARDYGYPLSFTLEPE